MTAPHIHIPYSRIQEHRDLIRKRALNLEIYFSGEVLDRLTRDDLISLQKELDYGPSLSFHAPFMDLSPGAVDSKVRAATIERFFHILDVAEVMHPRAIVFHSGYEKWKYAFNVDLWLEKSLLTWQPLKERAEDMGVRIAIENIFEDEPANLGLLMGQLSSEYFGICFDTGHCNLFSRVDLGEWMEALNPYILELHLHDNNRTSDQHLPVGEGTFDFERFFRMLQNRGCIKTIEAHSEDSVLRSLDNLNKFL